MFYIVNQETRELIRKSAKPFNADETVQPAPPLIQLKRVVDETRPPFNEATEKLVQIFTDDDETKERVFHFQKHAKTADEIAAYQRKLADAATLQQLKEVYADLKNGVGTTAVRITRCEKAIAYILREMVREHGLKL